MMASKAAVVMLHSTLAETPTLGEPVFHLSMLPKELRLQVWEEAIPAERVIHISLKPHEGRRYELAAAEPRYLERNSLRKPISGERYRAVVEGARLNSKFLRVNREARKAALDFYRVHIPAYMTGTSYTERTKLFLNPEHDILHIKADAPVKETMIDFLWDLKAYDPKDVGLLKLAIDLEGFCANDLQYLQRSDLFLIRQRRALVETLSKLTEVWFVNVLSSGIRGLKFQPESYPAQQTPKWALPVKEGGPTFQRLGYDQREGLEEQLEEVYLGEIDPREIVFRWRRLMRTWDIEHGPCQVAYHLVVSQSPEWKRRTWQTDKLAGDMESLTLTRDEHAQPDSGEYTEECSMDRADSRVTAKGFWLFPLEAIGELGEGEKLADMEFQPGRVFDMKDHWPELALFKSC